MMKRLIIFLFLVFFGLSVSLAQQNIRKKIEYYKNGRFKSVLYSNGAYREYDYDKNGNRRIVLERKANRIYIQPLGQLFFCQGSLIAVPYTVTGVYETDNLFRLEISDKDGNFDNLRQIGTHKSQEAGTVVGTIPVNLPAGIGYKIRVSSTKFAVESEPYAQVLTITAPPVYPPEIVVDQTQHTNTVVLSAVTNMVNPTFQWLADGQPIPNETNRSYKVATTQEVRVMTTNETNCATISDGYLFPLAIDDSLERFSKVYPNPTQSRDVVLEVQLPELYGKPCQLKLISSEGKIVWSAELSALSHQTKLSFAGKPSGVYILCLQQGKRTAQKRLSLN